MSKRLILALLITLIVGALDSSAFSKFVIDLSYNDDYSLLYTIPAFFGSNRQAGQDSLFVVDTTTPFVTISEIGCDNCSD